MIDIFKNIDTMVVTERKGDKFRVRVRSNIHIDHIHPMNLTEDQVNAVLRAFKILDDNKYQDTPKGAEGK